MIDLDLSDDRYNINAVRDNAEDGFKLEGDWMVRLYTRWRNGEREQWVRLQDYTHRYREDYNKTIIEYDKTKDPVKQTITEIRQRLVWVEGEGGGGTTVAGEGAISGHYEWEEYNHTYTKKTWPIVRKYTEVRQRTRYPTMYSKMADNGLLHVEGKIRQIYGDVVKPTTVASTDTMTIRSNIRYRDQKNRTLT